ncbi:MAG: phosphate regulon sensor histidine kinase PhoR, partial [Steroidobacteraceae bacterium]|nr:phosphate regulon sensor histidine kinase PhoR [Steroidobacteraceae bacterium]
LQLARSVAPSVIATLAFGVLLGWAAGSWWGGVAVAFLVLAVWQAAQLQRVLYWLRNRAYVDPPDTLGDWAELVAGIGRLHRRKRFHKARALAILRDLRRVAAALPDGVVLLNPQREIEWFNARAAVLLGLVHGRDIGLRIDNLLRQPQAQRYFAAGQFTEPLELQPNPAADTWIAVQPVGYGESRQLLLVRDVSAQRRIEAMRRDFVANASHELRSPLTVIAGYLENLETDPQLPQDLRAPVIEMRRQSDRMRALLDDLLELSRLESQEAAPVEPIVDVAALIDELVKDMRALYPQRARLSVEQVDTVRLRGDAEQIHSALRNLLDNAMKYTPPDGEVRVRWRRAGTGAAFDVQDTGPGIAPEHLPRLTERFYRVDAGRAREAGGTGLGLAIVKHILLRHDARLEVDSEEGRGSTFTCLFPAARVV